MKYWNFKVFITDNGTNEIDDWLQSMPTKASVRMRTIIKYLEIQRIFTKNYFSKIIGYTDIYELKFIHNNIQYRPLGCFGPGNNEFTLLIPAIEQGDKLIPKSAPKIAKKRFKLIQKDRRYIDDFV